MQRKRISKYLIIIFIIALILISGYNLWKMSEKYIREKQIKDSVAKYRPEYVLNASESTNAVQNIGAEKKASETHKNLFITDLQKQVNNDIVGWLIIPNTQIDYPFVISEDNDYYLRRDLYGNYALAGTLFMDYRCSKDFTNFNTIIYGHNMKNGSMFGELSLFADEEFFNSNRFGMIFLKDSTYTLEFFAYMIIKADDTIIYSNTSENKHEFFEYVKKSARSYLEPMTETAYIDNIYNINIMTLSTCSYEFNGARSVLLAIIIPI